MSRRSSPSLAGRAGQVMPPHAGRMEDNNNSAKHANALSAHERSVDVAAILPRRSRDLCGGVDVQWLERATATSRKLDQRAVL